MEITLLGLLEDALFAGLAAIGFAAVSQPPRRAFLPIAFLAALGHGLRYVLMGFGFDIAMASFVAATFVGFGGFYFGRRYRLPTTVSYIPALLPMIPGMYAYRAVLALVYFMNNHENAILGAEYMQTFLSNAAVATTVTFLLGTGSIIPALLLSELSYTMTRDRKFLKKTNR